MNRTSGPYPTGQSDRQNVRVDLSGEPPYPIDAQLLDWAASKTGMGGRPLSKTEKLVLVALAYHAKWDAAEKHIYARISMDELAAEALCWRANARSATKRLTKAGYLLTMQTIKDSGAGYGYNRYYFPLFEEAITGQPFVMPEGKPAFK